MPDDATESPISLLYDEQVARHYDADAHGLLGEAHRVALGQIDAAFAGRPPRRVIELGTGTGNNLVALRGRFPEAALIGLDLSADMLAVARGKFAPDEVPLIEASALDVGRHVARASQDLVLSHFLMAYLAPEELIPVCASLLAPGASLSIANTTATTFPVLGQLAAGLFSEATIHALSRVADSPAALVAQVEAAGLEVTHFERVERTFTLPDFDALYDLAVHQGWFRQFVEAMPPEALEGVRRQRGLFPLVDTFEAVVLLARRP